VGEGYRLQTAFADTTFCSEEGCLVCLEVRPEGTGMGKETARSCLHVDPGSTPFLGCVHTAYPSRAAPGTSHPFV
jgi:hypothetical protein